MKPFDTGIQLTGQAVEALPFSQPEPLDERCVMMLPRLQNRLFRFGNVSRTFTPLRSLSAIGVFLCLLSIPIVHAEVTYQYTGNHFTMFSCGPTSDNMGTLNCSTAAPANSFTTYTSTDHVIATLTLDEPLGANFPYSDIRALPGFQLVLNDGQHTVQTPLDSGQAMFSMVATDADGNISQWRFGINTGGLQNGGIHTSSYTDGSGPHAFDSGTMACCDPTVSGNLANNFNTAGTWTSDSPSDPASLVNNLISLVSNPELGLSRGQIGVFNFFLNGALRSINAGNTQLADLQLRVFIDVVRLSRRFRGISSETATSLISSAQAIRASLQG
ncbi:Hypothetical protein HDN1F_24310 [gamma proteobacterium HdN1]|nr:Hypothetical protein HDN1F_24310 [gamma proteobacterium HdN1]